MSPSSSSIQPRRQRHRRWRLRRIREEEQEPPSNGSEPSGCQLGSFYPLIYPRTEPKFTFREAFEASTPGKRHLHRPEAADHHGYRRSKRGHFAGVGTHSDHVGIVSTFRPVKVSKRQNAQRSQRSQRSGSAPRGGLAEASAPPAPHLALTHFSSTVGNPKEDPVRGGSPQEGAANAAAAAAPVRQLSPA